MRDALSLADQAIAYGEGKLTGAQVAEMLGTVDRGKVLTSLLRSSMTTPPKCCRW